MHDDVPESRHGESDDSPDTSETAFDALGLSALFEPTRENPVVGDGEPAKKTGGVGGADAFTRPPAFADTITSNPPTSAIFPWIAPKPGDTARLEAARLEAEQTEARRRAVDATGQSPAPAPATPAPTAGEPTRRLASAQPLRGPAAADVDPAERRSLAGLARPFPTSAEELLAGMGRTAAAAGAAPGVGAASAAASGPAASGAAASGAAQAGAGAAGAAAIPAVRSPRSTDAGPLAQPPAASTLPGVALTAPIADPAEQADTATSPRAQARAERAARAEAEKGIGTSSLAGLAKDGTAATAPTAGPNVVLPPVEPRPAARSATMPADSVTLSTTPINASAAAAFPWELVHKDEPAIDDEIAAEPASTADEPGTGATMAAESVVGIVGLDEATTVLPADAPWQRTDHGADAATVAMPTAAMPADAGASAVGAVATAAVAATAATAVSPIVSGAAAGSAGGVTGSGAAGGAGGRGADHHGGAAGGAGRGAGGGSGSGPFDGILNTIRRHPRAWLIAAIVVGALALGAVSFGLGAASPASAAGTPASTASPTPTKTPTPKPTVRATPAAVPAAATVRTCTVDQYASDPGFGTLEAQVRNASTGQVLYDRNGSDPQPTASVLKTLTAAAALNVLGPNYQVPTTVVKGTQPGQVVIIGGGDVTLSRLPSGQASYYTNAPHLDTLAQQVQQAWNADPTNNGQPITSLIVDTSLYSGPVWLPSWDEEEERVIEGSTPYIVPLMVDGDRQDPTALESPRSTTPVQNAAQDFASDLGGNVSITYNGTAPTGAKQLGQVLSQPVSVLVEQALRDSDNTLMEELARLVAIKDGAGNTFAAENQGTLTGLQYLGIPEAGLYFADGSGLSGTDRVPASYLTQFMIKVLDRVGNLGVIYDGLPIAGQTGTLGPGYGRFDGSYSSQADGQVNAKTGWIDQARTLSGVIHAKDGTSLTFAVYALNYSDDDAALNAIDNLTTAFYLCGNNLSNN